MQASNNIAILYASSKLGGLPAYVNAEPESRESLSKLASVAFADSGRSYPLHTKSAAYKSYLQLSYDGGKTKLRNIVKSACESLGIKEDIERVDALFNPAKQAGVASVNYALPEHKLWPLSNVGQVIESARCLQKDAHAMPVVDVRAAACRIKEAAARLGLPDNELPGIAAEIGDERLFDADNLADELRKRAYVCDAGSKDRAAYLELSKTAAELEHDEDLNEVADLVRTMDEGNPLVKRACDRGKLQSAVRAVFGGETMAAVKEAAMQSYDVQETLVPIAAFKAIPETEVRTMFKSASAETIIKAAKSAAHDNDVQKELAGFGAKEGARLLELAMKHGR